MQDRLHPAAFARFTMASDQPDVVLDLTGRDAATTSLRPLYESSPSWIAALGAVVDGRRPELAFASDGRCRIRFPCAIDDISLLTRALEQVFARICSTCFALIMGAAPAGATPATAPREGTALTSKGGAAFVVRQAVQKIADRLAGRLKRADHWRVAWRPSVANGVWETRDLSGQAFTVIPDDGARYYADPFPFAQDGRRWVFVEEYPYATGRGVISAIEMDDRGPVGPPRVVIDQPYHMSYPQVFAWAGETWMVPETSANRTVELWKADDLPHRWSRHAVLVPDMAVADATLFRHGGRWWMLGTVADDGGSAGDALHAWHAPDLLGPWTMAGRGPVLLDACTARPGGSVRLVDGALWRPAQDNSAHYGAALALCRIDALEPDGAFRQTTMARIAPPSGYRGFHTLNVGTVLEVIDYCGPLARGDGTAPT